jgi:HAMP domain-containing protein
VVLAAVIPVLLLLIPLLIQNSHWIREAAENELTENTRNMADGLRFRTDALRIQAKSLARDSDIERAAKVPIFMSQADHALDVFESENPETAAIFFLSPEGEIITAAPLGMEAKLTPDQIVRIRESCTPKDSGEVTLDSPILPVLGIQGAAWILSERVAKGAKGNTLGNLCFIQNWKTTLEAISLSPRTLFLGFGGKSFISQKEAFNSRPGVPFIERSILGEKIEIGMDQKDSPLLRRAKTFAVGLLFLALCLLLLLTGAALRITAKLFKPFQPLFAFATEYARGNYDAKAPELPFQEFQEMAGTLAEMGSHMKTYVENVNRISRLESAQARVELESLKNQLKPHFLFNALNGIITTLDGTPENTKVAKHALTSLAELYRMILDSSKLAVHPLGQEMQIVDHYLRLEKLRFADRLTYSISYPDRDRPLLDRTLIPSLLLQTLVENCVKHGIAKSISGGWIRIEFEMSPATRRLKVKISNSGEPLKTGFREGTGLRNTLSRLELTDSGNHGFQIRKDESLFTTVEFTLPLEGRAI